RRQLVGQVAEGHDADHRADPVHRAPVLARVHVHRHNGGVADDARQPGGVDARHRVVRVPDGCHRGLAGSWRDDVPVPVPGAPRRHVRDPAEPQGEDDRLMAVVVVATPRAAHSSAYRLRKLRGSILFWIGLALFIVFASFPVYWMFVTTFKEVNDLYNLQNNPLFFHLPPTLEQVRYLFDRTNFTTWVANTGEVGLAVVAI